MVVFVISVLLAAMLAAANQMEVYLEKVKAQQKQLPPQFRQWHQNPQEEPVDSESNARRHSPIAPAMACYHPSQAWKTATGVTFKPGRAAGSPLKLPCGQCIGCRLQKSREWAIRCVHEAQLHEVNSFVTLTYSDDNLPEHASLVPRHFDLFINKIRKAIYPEKVRYYMCGEYGENFGRPHYHAILFGLDFPDKTPHSRDALGTLYTSPFLEEVWGHGFCTIGAVTFESAAYCARYVLKKQTGKSAPRHYNTVDKSTGEIVHRVPEYARMSRRPGLGADWIESFLDDVYPHDRIVLKGKTVGVPRYYDKRLEARNPERLEAVKAKRIEFAEKHEHNNTRERLKVREKVHLAKIKTLKRKLA